MRKRQQAKGAWLFLAPFLILFTLFVLAPVVYGFWISLHNWHILSKDVPFIGLRNYSSAINDDLFRISLLRTGYFVLMVVPTSNALSLLFAIALNQKFRGTTLYKIAFYMPVLLSVTVVAVLWRWLYSREYGLLNHYMGTDIRWLEDPTTAMPALALMSVWWGAGGNMLIYLAGIKSVPKEILEAAALDGARPVQRFWHTTWPWIRPVTLFCVVMSIIGASQVFGQSYILTQGNPAYSTLTVILYMYQQGFGQYQLGYASAVAYLLFLVVFVLTLIQFKLLAPAKDRS
jgi:multiple sugar transport system permease protein